MPVGQIYSSFTGILQLIYSNHIRGAVEVAVGDGFHDVVVEDVGTGFEVGDGAGGPRGCG